MTDKSELKLNIPDGGVKKVSIPLLGKVEKTLKEGVYAVKEKAVVGKQYIVICPVCGKPILTKATEPKVFRAMHKTCNTPIIIKGIEGNSEDGGRTCEGFISGQWSETNNFGGGKSTDTDIIPVLGKPSNAELSWWSRTGKRHFTLRIGKNYVGRIDNDNPSDLSLKDEYASAKSICIEVNKSVRGYSFHLTVEHATNPVLINGKEQPEGSSFELNYGDIIKLGNTALTFKPVKK